MSESSPDLIVERDGPILICTMNRPERRNAFSPEMLGQMYDAWVELSQDPELRVGIVTGADGNFSSGADLKAMAQGGGETQGWECLFIGDLMQFQQVFIKAILSMGLVNGLCTGRPFLL